MIDKLSVVLITCFSFYGLALYMLYQYFSDQFIEFSKDHCVKESARYMTHERECKLHRESLTKVINENDQSLSICFHNKHRSLEARVDALEQEVRKNNSDRPKKKMDISKSDRFVSSVTQKPKENR